MTLCFFRNTVWTALGVIVAFCMVWAMTTVLFSSTANAEVTMEDLPTNRGLGDFVVGPGKVELLMQPGETKVIDVRVTNRMGEPKAFSLTLEDFTGSKDPNQTIQLLGGERGPYSLKDFLKPEVTEITIEDGFRATIPVTVTIPEDAEPGGLFGSVIVETVSKPSGVEGVGGTRSGAAIVSRIGVLFFVRVAGDVEEEGKLVQFSTKNNTSLFLQGPIDFTLLYENTGSVHVNPYGFISIKNMFGEEVGEEEIEPWFALPGAVRLREVSWDRPYLIGRYIATAEINRGFDETVDRKEVVFWVIPIKLVGGIVLGVLLLLLILRWMLTRFEIKRKGK